MKKIIILGAGIYQVPLIKKAKEKGFYTIVISIPGNYPGFNYADKVYYTDTRAKDEILEIAKKENIEAILTTGTDVAMSTVGYVCDKLNLHGISYASSVIATDKYQMKNAFLEHGVRSSRFLAINSEDDLRVSFDVLDKPVMIKVTDMSGSRGITKVSTYKELIPAYNFAKQYTKKDYVLMEEFVDGVEIGIDALIQNSEIKCIVPHEKLTHNTGKTDVPVGHICPFSDNSLIEEIDNETIKAIRALNLDNCAVNIDAFITKDNKISIIEIACRCGATGIPEVISNYLGIDYYDWMIKCATGEFISVPDNYSSKPCASVLFFSDKEGELESISYMVNGNIYTNRGFADDKCAISLDYRQKDLIHRMQNGTDRIGQAIITADTKEQLINDVEVLLNSISVIVR